MGILLILELTTGTDGPNCNELLPRRLCLWIRCIKT